MSNPRLLEGLGDFSRLQNLPTALRRLTAREGAEGDDDEDWSEEEDQWDGYPDFVRQPWLDLDGLDEDEPEPDPSDFYYDEDDNGEDDWY